MQNSKEAMMCNDQAIPRDCVLYLVLLIIMRETQFLKLIQQNQQGHFKVNPWVLSFYFNLIYQPDKICFEGASSF